MACMGMRTAFGGILGYDKVKKVKKGEDGSYDMDDAEERAMANHQHELEKKKTSSKYTRTFAPDGEQLLCEEVTFLKSSSSVGDTDFLSAHLNSKIVANICWREYNDKPP